MKKKVTTVEEYYECDICNNRFEKKLWDNSSIATLIHLCKTRFYPANVLFGNHTTCDLCYSCREKLQDFIKKIRADKYPHLI